MPDTVYKPSWVDRVIDWIDRLPFPAWIFYGAMYLVGISMIHGALWLDGVVPVGTVSATWLSNGVWTVVSLAFIHYLQGVARRSLDKFAPLVANKPTEYAAVRHRMTGMPARPVFWMTVVAGLVIVTGIGVDPAFAYEGLEHPVSYALAGSLMVVAYCFTPVVIFFAFRTLGSVSRAYALLDEVDVVNQRPLYAFSSLTMRAGLVWLMVVNLNVLTTVLTEDVVNASLEAINISFTALGIVIAFVSFLYPLRGIHRRLVDEKNLLIEQNAAAVNRTRVKFYAALERQDHPEVESFDRGLSSLFRLKDELLDIPTWPWRPGTFRTFLSAVVLPIVVWVAQQLLTTYL